MTFAYAHNERSLNLSSCLFHAKRESSSLCAHPQTRMPHQRVTLHGTRSYTLTSPLLTQNRVVDSELLDLFSYLDFTSGACLIIMADIAVQKSHIDWNSMRCHTRRTAYSPCGSFIQSTSSSLGTETGIEGAFYACQGHEPSDAANAFAAQDDRRRTKTYGGRMDTTYRCQVSQLRWTHRGCAYTRKRIWYTKLRSQRPPVHEMRRLQAEAEKSGLERCHQHMLLLLETQPEGEERSAYLELQINGETRH